MSDAPQTRGDCVDGPRPCPWLSCRYHIDGDVDDYRTTHVRVADRRGMETCALDLAELGGLSVEQVGNYMGVTRERIGQIERDALHLIRSTPCGHVLAQIAEDVADCRDQIV